MVEMTNDVGLVEILSDGLVVLRWMGRTSSPRDAIWSLGKQRKAAKCAVTGLPLQPGDYAFRPIGNQDYRGKRISALLVAELVRMATATRIDEEE